MGTVIDRVVPPRCDKTFYVYAHARPDNGEIFYIGKGQKNRAWRSLGRNRHWTNVANKHGFKVEIIRDGLTEKEAFDLEIEKILDIGIENLCNYALGGGGSSGYKLTDLQKSRQIAGLTGRKLSEETRAKISLSNTGKIRTAEAKSLMAIAHLGKKRSSESIEKQRSSMLYRARERKSEIYGRMMKLVSCTNGMRFNSLADAGIWADEAFGVSGAKSAISKCASGKRKTAYGLGWSYSEAVKS